MIKFTVQWGKGNVSINGTGLKQKKKRTWKIKILFLIVRQEGGRLSHFSVLLKKCENLKVI